MATLTIDFETYYSQEYSLTKMTTEEYIRSHDFEVIGVAVQVDDGEPQWFSGTMAETELWLAEFDWGNNLALAHNAMFDAAILNWCFGIKPKGWLDTLSMARALHGTEVGGSLKVLAEHYNLGVKGEEVIAAKGLRRLDFPFGQLAKYGEYCRNDVVLTYALFNKMVQEYPADELRLIDLTIRMFSDPVLRLHKERLAMQLGELKTRREELLENFDEKDLMSNPKFAELLRAYGVEPPMKISPTTGKETYAFSKTDEAFKELLEHENVEVQALVAARLGVKSTIEQTRTERFLAIAERGTLPVPLRYYAAHTGRWGGDDKVNLQNLPRKSKLKSAIVAPKGYVIIDSDSSQIEARTLAWLAGQTDLVAAFENKQDVYKIMASAIYRKPIEEISKEERFVGKTTILGCIAEGTLVLCDSGWKPIEQVSIEDKLWDGEEWVCHQGLQNSGIKETLNLCGIWLTPDHRVWSGTQWLEAQSLAQDGYTRYQALGTAAANLPLQAIYGAYGEGWQHSSCVATATATITPLTNTILKTLRAPVAHFAPRLQHTSNGTGCIQTHWPTTPTEQDCLTVWHLPSQDATSKQANPTPITAGAALPCVKNGGMIEPVFSSMYKRLVDGTTQLLRSIGLMSTATTSPATSALLHEATTSKTNDESPHLRRRLQTYDLAYSGPRNRYVVLTEQGPMIVHNCGYGMGPKKFQAQLKNFGVIIDLPEATRVIDTYRRTYPHITKLWGTAHETLRVIEGNYSSAVSWGNALHIDGRLGIRLPNGLHLKYPNLRHVINTDTDKDEWVYDTKRGKQVIPTRIYGGKIVENICQALARIIIGAQMLMVAKKYRVVMTVHDAIACIAREEEAETAKEYVELCMRLRPQWAQYLPLDCEAGYGVSYGDC